jgi:predicted outer membrane protein
MRAASIAVGGLAAAIFGVGAAGAASISATTPATSAAPAPVPTDVFLREANASDAIAAQSSQLALSTSNDSRIQAFARRMIERRGGFTHALEASVGAEAWNRAVSGPTIGDAESVMGALRQAAQKGAFDRAYLQAQANTSAALWKQLQAFADRGTAANGIPAPVTSRLRAQARTFARQVERDLAQARMLLMSKPPAP